MISSICKLRNNTLRILYFQKQSNIKIGEVFIERVMDQKC